MQKISSLISSFKKSEVSEIFKNAQEHREIEGLEFFIMPSKKLDFGRILVITPRKIGSAPKRNKIRRRLKSIFYEEKFFNLKLDCVVIVGKYATKLSFDSLKNIVNSVFK